MKKDYKNMVDVTFVTENGIFTYRNIIAIAVKKDREVLYQNIKKEKTGTKEKP